jgi:hypothetical protein
MEQSKRVNFSVLVDYETASDEEIRPLRQKVIFMSAIDNERRNGALSTASISASESTCEIANVDSRQEGKYVVVEYDFSMLYETEDGADLNTDMLNELLRSAVSKLQCIGALSTHFIAACNTRVSVKSETAGGQ